MKQEQEEVKEGKPDLTKRPVKFQFDISYKQFFASIIMVGLFFLMPIELITNWASISKNFDSTFNQVAGPQVAGVSTDNSGRYFNIPIINFKFDSTLSDPATISFTFGFILFILSIIIILLMFADFRKKEQKYR